jgi:hypothetical protein
MAAGLLDEVALTKGPSKRAVLLASETVWVFTNAATQATADNLTAPLQPLFSDELLTVSIANPTAADSLGNIVFWADASWVWVKVGTHPARRVRINQVGPQGATGAPGTAAAAASTRAALGTPTAGEIRRVTDSVRGLWAADGTNWISLNGEAANVKHFLAAGNDVTDDTAAIQAAHNAAAALGGTVVFPPGNYVVAGALSWLADEVAWIGAGGNATQLRFTGTGVGLTVGDGTNQRNGIDLRHLTLRGVQTQPATGLWLRNCWQVNLLGVNFSDFATYHLNSENGGHKRLTQCQFASNVSTTAIFCRLYSEILDVLEGITFEGGGGAGASKFLVIEGGNGRISVLGMVGSGGHGTTLEVGGLTQGVTVNGLASDGCTVAGIIATGADDLKLSNIVLIAGPSPSGAGIQLGSTVRASLSDFTVLGWADAAVQYPGAVDIKIHDGYIAGTRPLLDSTGATGIVHDVTIPGGVPTVTGVGVKYYNNPPWQPQGAATIAVGASPFTYTAGATPEAVYIRGGTVSDVSKNGRTLFVASPATVMLEPGEAVVVTYSAAPTMERDRK